VFYFENFIAVEKALPQVVPSISPDKARILFYESRERGVAVVIVTVKVSHLEYLVVSGCHTTHTKHHIQNPR
jgi:hypothetical protein